MSDCKTYRSQIENAADAGGLSRETLAHVRTCRACADFWRQGVSLRRAVRELERVEAPADFEFRLRARIARHGGMRRENFFAGFYRIRNFAPLAAAVCFLTVSASLYFWHSRHAPMTAPTPKETNVASATTSTATGPTFVQDTPGRTVVQEAQSRAVIQGTTDASSIASTFNPVVVSPAVVRSQASGARQWRASAHRTKNATFGEDATVPTQSIASFGSAPVRSQLPLKISVGTSAEPLRVVLRDETGAARVVPMRTVSFGSQQLLARSGVQQRASASENEGVW